MTTDSLFVYRNCPICGKEKYRELYKAKVEPFFAERFNLHETMIASCTSCGLRYTNPVLRPEIEALQYLQGEGYNPPANSSLKRFGWEDQIICFLELCAKTDVTNKRILDVGCGEGGFVYLCQKNGLDAYGIELNPNAVNRAVLLGVRNVSPDSIQSIESDSFDVLSAIHLLEHLQDCREFARQTSRVLKPQGIAMVIVPNYFSFQWRFREKRYWNQPYQHMNGLTVQTLDFLYGEFGFQRVPLQLGNFIKTDKLSLKTKISMTVTNLLGNALNLFPTKLFCVYRKN